MIRVHEIAPSNEMAVAQRLKARIEQEWPDIADHPRDRVDLLVGVRTPTDVDILVIIDLDRPREIPACRRRDGTMAPPGSVQYALFAIEIKQLDIDRIERVGNQLFATYDGGHRRNVAQQAHDAARGVAKFARESGFHPFVYGLAWLTEVSDATLVDIEACILGCAADWSRMLDAAAQQSIALYQTGNHDTARAVVAVRERLLNRRKDSARDRARIERLSRDLATKTAVDRLVTLAGTAQIRLLGRGGSGKTTTLALLAVRLAEAGERVLILTFHRTLRADIAHLVNGLSRDKGFPADRIHVETTAGFLISAIAGLGVDIPMSGDAPNYPACDALFAEWAPMLVGDADDSSSDLGRLRAKNPERFGWDYVFVDEAQDCTDGERDLLRALFGHRRTVLADGMEQLVRRQVACDWNAGVLARERVVHRLDESLRMLRNISLFVNSAARALGFETWRVDPCDELPGGRIMVVSGDIATPEFVRAVVNAAASNKADVIDCLVCVPPSAVAVDADGKRRANFGGAATAAGVAVWDGTEPAARSSPIESNDVLRIVQYDSCRGLEGWITVAQDLDAYYLNRLKYPNLQAGDGDIAPDLVARRMLLIPLTRAVHTLIISVRDADSVVGRAFREAAEDLSVPRDVVEFVDVAECVRRLALPLLPTGSSKLSVDINRSAGASIRKGEHPWLIGN